ncbi:class I SAM-dependent methyltransferase [Francisellaceae bacterium CB300]
MSNNSFFGQKIYSKTMLKFYNFYVLFFNNNYVWKCKTSNLLQNYEEHLSANHLDIGVGTGYYLDKVRDKISKLTLVDLNDNCLDKVKGMFKNKSVETIKFDILGTLPKEYHKKFDSISFNYLIHCIPNTSANKSEAFENVARMLTNDGVAFGSTIINDYKNTLATKTARKFNEKKIFDNTNDTYKTIEKCLESNFNKYSLSQIGSVCIFSMSEPKF